MKNKEGLFWCHRVIPAWHILPNLVLLYHALRLSKRRVAPCCRSIVAHGCCLCPVGCMDLIRELGIVGSAGNLAPSVSRIDLFDAFTANRAGALPIGSIGGGIVACQGCVARNRRRMLWACNLTFLFSLDSHSKQAGDECRLLHAISFFYATYLTFPEHVNRFISL